jgi:LmbE family N-acetylglucosaminyl deacetylase
MDDRLNIILSPHFDDAVFSLGGLIATAPERTIVVTIFAGTPADGVNGRWDRRSGFKTAAVAMTARRLENEAALAVLALPPDGIVNFDFLDRQYRTGGPADAGMRSAIAAAVREVVRDHGAAANLYCPASAWHPDHGLLTDAVVALWKTGECGDVSLFLYQDQPYAYLELRRRTLAPLRFAALGIAEDRHGVAMRPLWLGFDQAAAAKKRLAAKRYKSQFPLVRHLLCKMIGDFSRYQARAGGLSSSNAELVYRLAAPGPHS